MPKKTEELTPCHVKPSDLTAQEKDKLSQILNEDTDLWTAKGFGSGLLCEDAQSRQVVYSSKAKRDKMETQRVVEQKVELELAKQQKALKLALEGFDADVLKQSADTQAKYHSLIQGMRQAEAECEALTTDLKELRKKRSSLKSQKKKLEQVLQKLEEQDILEIQSQIVTLTNKGACEAVSSLDLTDV